MKENDRGGRRRRGGRLIRRLLVTLALLAALAAAFRFGLPGLWRRVFSHRQEITAVTVERRLAAIGELATYSMTYSGQTEAQSMRQIFGLNIPGTRNSVKIAYSGTIKVGYEVADIDISVDADAGVIRVKLPEAKVISNAIDEDSLRYEQRNNILNPIKGDVAANYLDQVRASELKEAEGMGLYEKAEENARRIIADNLAVFEGWEVAFE